MSRHFYMAAGWLSVAIGVIGIVLPLLPTTPLLILAAFCFSKGSPRARIWLIDHGHLGPPIRKWEEEGAIAPRAKALGVGAMIAVFALSVAMGLKPILLVIQGLCLGGAALFVLTRPSGARP